MLLSQTDLTHVEGCLGRSCSISDASDSSSITLCGDDGTLDVLDLKLTGQTLSGADRKTLAKVSEHEIVEIKLDGERQPLLGLRKCPEAKPKHQASTFRAFFLLLNAFIGPGILFLPRAFMNGGVLFSSATIAIVGVISFLAMRLLLQCRARYELGGFGEIGTAIAGRGMGQLITTSITMAQLGSVCTSAVFVANALQSVICAFYPTAPLSLTAFIIIQLAILIPLSLVRNISKLTPASFTGNLLVVISVVYICSYDITTISTRAAAPQIQLFNPSSYNLTIGSAIFVFQSMGLLIPIHDSMAKPQHFQPLLLTVIVTLAIIFESVGILSYLAYGPETQTIVLNNLPQSNLATTTIQLFYGLAVLVGYPIQLFPVLRIFETKIFGLHRSGRTSQRIKWTKNLTRAMIAIGCIVISVVGSRNLDQFVALIGSVTALPLLYIYPPLLHFWAIAETKKAKAFDIVLLCIGFVSMVYVTAMTILHDPAYVAT